MTENLVDGNAIINSVSKAVSTHGATLEALIPILNEVNSELGYLPRQALQEISRLLKVPKSQLFSVASFYQMLSTKPRGRHVVQFCESAPCHVVGGRQVFDRLIEELKLQPQESSPDGKWTFITVSCLGLCGVAPVIIIDDDMFGNVKPEQIPDILSRYN